MSKFWKAYASVSDDLRHHLVERAWFGRETTGNINEQDMPGMKDPKAEQANTVNNFYGNSQQHNDNSVEKFYGLHNAKIEVNADNDTFHGKPAAERATSGQVQAPKIEEPAIEAPAIEAPKPSNAPEPGY